MFSRRSYLALACVVVLAAASVSEGKKQKPHILLVLADDLGYGNVGWNRNYFKVPSKEVQTPVMDELVADGIQLERFYVFHSCGPTRSALQTGRVPIHVCDANHDPCQYSEKSATGIGAGIPRNMTGMASKMRQGGYRTHMAGKWDAGMATVTHTPVGRGYESQLCYFHHANSYWNEQTGGACGVGVDFYDTKGPAYGQNASSKKPDYRNISAYEDFLFQERVLAKLEAHDPNEPLFMFYAAHLVHLPYEVPDQYKDKLAPFVDNSTEQGDMRLTYAAMVNFLDGVVGNITAAFKAKGMWDDTLMIFLSDNGGPIYAGGNNYPLKGGKYSEFEGGVRSAAFVSGGYLSQNVRGTIHHGLGSVADIYTTLASIAGVSQRDEWAVASGLPDTDGFDLSDMILRGQESPRREVPLSTMHDADLTKWSDYEKWHNGTYPAKGHKQPQCWKVQACDFLDADLLVKKNVDLNDCCDLCAANTKCAVAVWKKETKQCHLKKTSNKQVVDEVDGTCFLNGTLPFPKPIIGTASGIIVGDLKLILGTKIPQAVFTGPAFPNASTPWITNSSMKVPTFDCSTPQKIGCLFNITADPTEHHDLAADRQDDAMQLLHRLRNWSATYFNPDRGAIDPRACKQFKKNHGFYGPWLELPSTDEDLLVV